MGTHSQIGCHRVQQSSTFFAEHGYLQTPSLVQWMATLRCGLSCAHCLAVSREAGFADMPLEKVRGLIDEVAQMGVGEFLLTGGEPLVREDLGEVIEYLGRKGMSWTLNTAAMPGKGLREVISRHRPGFVAVSLDGPRPVHDAFRGKAGAWDEAMEAIRFFKSLAGVRVCAGTTVTSRNYDALDETFHLVTGSGADRWGIHLLVPEGRAADRPDLFLTKAQLKRLIKFVARRRRYFHVEMADEIGYLGYLEPLVRDVPLHCGAGRAQCVVLPDGEVVPCTTLDRSCSAGNVRERSLAQIWAEGFQDLRAWRPSGKCGRCDYAIGCRGGCWLQRKAGMQCFKEVWHVPGALKTAAGIAICLGGLAAPQDAGAAVTAASPVPPAPPLNIYRVTAAASITLDEAINNWYFEQAAGLEAGRLTPSDAGVDWNEPAWKFFKDFKEGTLPQDISERCARVVGALESNERSLSLIALLWRAVSEPLLEGGGSGSEYSATERQAIRNALAALECKAHAWRVEIFIRDLDPYLSGGRITDLPRGPMSKAGPRPGDRERYALSKDLNEERWGIGTDPDTEAAAVAYLLEHPYAEQIDLAFSFSKPGAILQYTADEGEVVISTPIGRSYTGLHQMGPFDVIEAVEDVTLSFQMKGRLRARAAYEYGEESLLNDPGEDQDVNVVLQVSLAAGQQCTYAELLKLVYEQHSLQLVSIAYDWLSSKPVPLWNQNVAVVAAVYENGALLWPALWEIIESDSIIPTGRMGDASRLALSAAEIAEIHRRAVLKDIDFWMF